MHLIFYRRTPGQIEFGVIYGLIAMLALGAARFLPILLLTPACAFRAMTGFPCPTCGSTRAIVDLAHGRFLAAFAMNPLIAASVFILFLIFFYSVVTFVFDLYRVRIVLVEREKDVVRIAVVLGLLFNWVYLFLAL